MFWLLKPSFYGILLAALFIEHVHTFECTTDGVVYGHTGTSYVINTCQPCGAQTPQEVPVCDVQTLIQKLQTARRSLRDEYSSLRRRIPLNSGMCQVLAFNYSEFRNGISVAETLRSSYHLLTKVALRLSIVSQHPNTLMTSDLHGPIIEALCEMKSRIMYTNSAPWSYTAELLRPEPFSRTSMTLFTCRNLRQAADVLHHVIRNIESDVNSDMVPAM